MSPLPTMIKGVLADFNTEMASVMLSQSAKLTGGGGQQDTTLQEKHTSVNFNNLVSQEQFCVEKNKSKIRQKMITNLTLLLSTLALTMSPATST